MTIHSKVLPFLWSFIRRQPIPFIIFISTGIVWSFNEVFFPYFLKMMVNHLHDYKGDRHHVYQVLNMPMLALFAIWVVMEFSMRFQGITLLHLFPKFRANIRKDVFNYIKHHSHDYFSNNFAGTIANKLSSLPTSCQTVIEITCFNFINISMAFFIALVMMWMTNPWFALILLSWSILHMGASWIFLKPGSQQAEEHAESVTTLNGKIVDSITNILNVRLFARGNYESEYLRQYQDEEIYKAKKAQWTIEKLRICQGILALSLIFSMVNLLIHGWINGWVTLGDFSLIGMLTFWMLGMIWYLSFQLTMFVREIATISDALTLVSSGHDIVDAKGAKKLHVTRGEIRFENINFAYKKNKPVFQDLNVVIKPGQKIGLVGFSGAGKSSFVNLILRFYDLNSGKILIDNQDIAHVTQASLHEAIAMIPQEPSLFHRTLFENIHYGRLEASKEEVIHAAKLAHCHEFIEKIPEGYQTLVGERGIKLSGGQRQRIAIARAILKNAPILILDEATSSLDSVTEKMIQESLHQLMQHSTTIVVAHRLSTLADMDRILVFHQGKIIEDGNKDELLSANGHFAHLWNMQINGFLPD